MNLLWSAALLLVQGPGIILITSPQAGDVLRGTVSILGTIDVPGFVSAELDFAYADRPAEDWFRLSTIDAPAIDGVLGTWDTTVITDGDYVLRVRAYMQDGGYEEGVVSAISIRNDVLPATAAGIDISPTRSDTSGPGIKPTVEVIGGPAEASPRSPRSTALPTNPAGLSRATIYEKLWVGAGLMLASLLLFGLLVRFRRG